jgi:hypothetical protein
MIWRGRCLRKAVRGVTPTAHGSSADCRERERSRFVITGRRLCACSRGSKICGWSWMIPEHSPCARHRLPPMKPNGHRTARARRFRAGKRLRSQPADEGRRQLALRRPIRPPETPIGNARSNSNSCMDNAQGRSADAGSRSYAGPACGANLARSATAATHSQRASIARHFEQARREHRCESCAAVAMKTDPA